MNPPAPQTNAVVIGADLLLNGINALVQFEHLGFGKLDYISL
jgi:hypothetical protein